MRTIDADKLKEKIIAFRLKNEGSNVIYNTALGKVIKAIDEQPTIGDWVQVSERLPEKDVKVLVMFKSQNRGHIRIGFDRYTRLVIEDNCYDRWEGKGNRVIAWQPLPEPYEEEIEQ